MASVLPGSPPSFSKEDPIGTVRAVCNYLHTLQENLDFQLTQLQKSIDGNTKSIESISATVKTLVEAVKELEAKAQAQAATIVSIGEDMTALENRVLALEQK